VNSCPVCLEVHTRREQAIPCLKSARASVKPFSKGESVARGIRIESVEYYENLPTQAVSDLDVVKLVEASNTEMFRVIPWECPYILSNPHPHFDKGIPHPSKLALELPTMPGRGSIYQCVDCLLFFTDCTTGDGASCEAHKCKYFVENNGKHELVMHYRPLYHELTSERLREHESKQKKTRVKKEMPDKLAGLAAKLKDDPELAAELERLLG